MEKEEKKKKIKKDIIISVIAGCLVGVGVPATMNHFKIGFDHGKASQGYTIFMKPQEEPDKLEEIKAILEE